MTTRLITIGISHYPSEDGWSTTRIEASRQKVEGIFRRHGLAPHQWTGTKAELETEFQDWAARRLVGEDTAHVLYWTGHGADIDGNFWLATSESKHPLHLNKAVSSFDLAQYLTAELAERVGASSDAWTLFIIDSCASGPGIRRIRDAFKKEKPALNVALIGTSEDLGSVYSGDFPRLLGNVLRNMDEEVSDSISVKELVRRVGDQLGPDQAWEAMRPFASLPKTGTAPPNFTAPVDVQPEIARILKRYPDAARTHFFPKAQGAEINEPWWFFRGRVSERRRINDWLENAGTGLLVVTGVAGSGKSALLGMILASTDLALMEALEKEYDLGGADLCPRNVRFDAVIHLSGQDVDDCIKLLTNDLGLTESETADEFISNIRERASQVGRLTILADALDESRDPFTIATGVFGRLAKLPGVRVLIGTRRSLGEDPDSPQPTRQNLLSTLNLRRDQLIELVPDPSAIARYVRDKLTATLPASRANEIVRIADRVGYSDQPFLFARLAVHEIVLEEHLRDAGIPAEVLAPSWLDAAPAALAELLEHGHSGIFARAIERYRATAPQVEALLRALAYAYGNGFPRNDGIWAIAGSALFGDDLHDADINDALIQAAPYIMKDTEHHQTVYRLAHRTFVERYRLNESAE